MILAFCAAHFCSRSCISASRIIASRPVRKCAETRRIWPIHLPMLRSAPGSSLGPMATTATMMMSRSSLGPISNMDAPWALRITGRWPGWGTARCSLRLSEDHGADLGAFLGVFQRVRFVHFVVEFVRLRFGFLLGLVPPGKLVVGLVDRVEQAGRLELVDPRQVPAAGE